MGCFVKIFEFKITRFLFFLYESNTLGCILGFGYDILSRTFNRLLESVFVSGSIILDILCSLLDIFGCLLGAVGYLLDIFLEFLLDLGIKRNI